MTIVSGLGRHAKLAIRTAAAAGACALIAGVTVPATAAAAAGGTLKWVIDDIEWSTLDPALAAFRGTDQPISSLIYGNLFKVGPHYTYQPGLALSHQTSKDGLTFTMKLRSGVKFQDGTPFNATAVKDSLTRDLNPNNQCSCLAFLKPIKSITTEGNNTVQLHFSQPDGTIMAALSGSAAAYVASPTAVAKEGKNFGTAPVGAGPFKVTKNAINTSLTLSSWPGYYDPKHVHLSAIDITTEDSGPSEYATVQSGGAQMLNLPFGNPTVEKEAKSNSNLKVTTALGYAGLIYLNPGKAPFNNLTARQAVQYATNAPALSKGFFLGEEPATEQLAGKGQAGYPGNNLPGYPKYNLSKAKALVQKLGGLSFTINTGTDPTAVQETQELQQQWEQAGITVTIAQLSSTAGIAALQAGNFQASVSAYSSQPDSVGALSNVIACPSLFNPKFCDKQINSLFDKAQTQSSLTKQAALVRQAEVRAIVDDAAFIPLVQVPEVSIASKSVKGLVVAGTQVYASGVSL